MTFLLMLSFLCSVPCWPFSLCCLSYVQYLVDISLYVVFLMFSTSLTFLFMLSFLCSVTPTVCSRVRTHLQRVILLIPSPEPSTRQFTSIYVNFYLFYLSMSFCIIALNNFVIWQTHFHAAMFFIEKFTKFNHSDLFTNHIV